ncbi:MAG TPA: 1,4-dihydroxy-2-naphthoate polyprenyltransferase [Beutenbergiaceae bacterium]|nr:1,4-dihydroxy-2-naphthoate polyprenyltransferase [Beutenbergiaceae bacterium]
MSALGPWLQGARPRTLPAALAPVAVGTGAAAFAGAASLPRALLAAGVALAMQIGVNFANDYSDGIRGTDDQRVGPVRLTATGVVAPAAVKRAAFLAFGAGAVFGLALCIVAGAWWLLGVGALCVLAGWFYTGGSSPYGYSGLGEVAVFVFFGLVATLGTTFTQAGTINGPALLGAAAVGLLACALLMANNIRDIPTDTGAGKRTLAVRLGDRGARWGYVLMVLGGVAASVLVALWQPWALLVLPLALPAALLCRRVLAGARGPDLIRVLAGTGMLELAIGVVLGLTLAVPVLVS